jgi:folate-binding protein YgfZ
VSAVGWFREVRDVVTVQGPDAVGFLQGQLSQDIAALAVGASTWTFVLQPTGKVASFARALRTAEAAIELDVDAGHAGALVARLERFKLRVRVEITTVAAVPHVVLLGAGAAEAAADASGVALVGWWADADAAAVRGGADPLGPPLDDPARARIAAGWPALGAELDDDVIPAESGVVPVAVSFQKGCYTGQELTARIDSRGGNVPRHLRHVHLGGAAVAGDAVTFDGREVGRLTSVAGDLALAYVARAVEPPALATVGGHEARIEAIRS